MTPTTAASAPITARFRSSFGELYRAHRDISASIPRMRAMRRVAWICGAVAVLAMLAGLHLSATGVALIGLLVLVPAVILPLQLLLPAYVAWLVWRSPTWSHEHDYTFTEEGIRGSRLGADGFTRWEAIGRVAETRRFLLLFISDQQALFVPRRALPNAAAADAFASFVRAHAGQRREAEATATEPETTLAGPALVTAMFQWEPREASRAAVVAARRGNLLWPWYVLMALLVAYTTGPTVYHEWRAAGWRGVNVAVVLLGLLPLLLIVVAGPLSARVFTRRQARTGPSVIGPQTISLHGDGVAVRGALANGAYRWPTLMKVVETGEFFLFFTTKVNAVHLPKRVLTGEQLVTVRELVRDRMASRTRVRSEGT